MAGRPTLTGMNELWDGLIGALIGGGLTSWAAWATTKAQWNRELKRRDREALDSAVVTFDAALKPLRTATVSGRYDESVLADLLAPVSYGATLVLARGRRTAPALAASVDALTSEVMTMAETTVVSDWPSNRVGLRRAVMALEGSVLAWISDPELFEREQRPVADWLRIASEGDAEYDAKHGVQPVEEP